MKLVHKDIEKNGSGQVVLIPEESEDMWHLYNLVSSGDSLKSTTIRKVKEESTTGSSSASKVRTVLTLSVEAVEFDTIACSLRIKGRNIQENQYVKMGAYHTIDIQLNQRLTLAKLQWDVVCLDRLELSCDPSRTADVSAVIMQEGLAHICLVTQCMTITRAKIEQNIPRKRKGSCSQHEKSLMKFYETVLQAIVRHIRFDVVKCVLVASPGFVKDQFFDYMMTEAVKQDIRVLIENKAKFLLVGCIWSDIAGALFSFCLCADPKTEKVHSSSGHRYALKEVLTDPVVTSKLADTKAASEVKALDTFYHTLQNEPDRAYYGLDHVLRANDSNAIDVLMLTDELFRSSDLVTRKKYVSLVESVRENGGDVKIFSSLHLSGEQLGQLSGVAALLRFPLPNIESGSDNDSDND